MNSTDDHQQQQYELVKAIFKGPKSLNSLQLLIDGVFLPLIEQASRESRGDHETNESAVQNVEFINSEYKL